MTNIISKLARPAAQSGFRQLAGRGGQNLMKPLGIAGNSQGSHYQHNRIGQHQHNQQNNSFMQFQRNFSTSEKMEFKAETKKLLDIVAKSLYTDKEVRGKLNKS